jgi:hypothetical protein
MRSICGKTSLRVVEISLATTTAKPQENISATTGAPFNEDLSDRGTVYPEDTV